MCVCRDCQWTNKIRVNASILPRIQWMAQEFYVSVFLSRLPINVWPSIHHVSHRFPCFYRFARISSLSAASCGTPYGSCKIGLVNTWQDVRTFSLWLAECVRTVRQATGQNTKAKIVLGIVCEPRQDYGSDYYGNLCMRHHGHPSYPIIDIFVPLCSLRSPKHTIFFIAHHGTQYPDSFIYLPLPTALPFHDAERRPEKFTFWISYNSIDSIYLPHILLPALTTNRRCCMWFAFTFNLQTQRVHSHAPFIF